MDGVNSMTGNAPDLPAFAEVARRHGALLYVDDAHGFGVIGERGADEPSPYGVRGNSDRAPLRRDLRQPRARRRLLEGVLVAAGLHRLPDRGQGPAEGRGAAVPLLGPVAGRLAGDRARRLRRQRAPRRRAARRRCTRSPRACSTPLARSASHTPNRSGLPIIEIPVRDHTRIDAVGRFLFERGVYVTLAAYPLVPQARGRLPRPADRRQHRRGGRPLIAALDELVERGELQPRRHGVRERGDMSAARHRGAPRLGRLPRRRRARHARSTCSCRRSRAAAR